MSAETTDISDPELYLKKHHVMAYIQDAVTFLLERKDQDPKTKPYELLAEYFESIKKGTHVLFRDYTFVSLTPHNRASFIRLFWHSYSEVAVRGDSLKVVEYLSLLRLLCHNFPSDVINKIARVLFSYDAMENLVSFSDFIYTFQTLFYYELFLKRCEEFCSDIASGQTPRNLLGASTVIVSVPSSGIQSVSSRPETANSLQSGVSTSEAPHMLSAPSGFDEVLDVEVFIQAITNLCQRFEREPWERCPNIKLLVEIVTRLSCLTFYDFVLALARSEKINRDIGVLPDRNALLTADKLTVFNSPVQQK